MWRAARIVLLRPKKETKLRVAGSVALYYRCGSSAAALASDGSLDFPDMVGLNFKATTIHSHVVHSHVAASSPLQHHVKLPPTLLERSVSTIDAALHSVVQFPWLANPLLQVVPYESHQNVHEALRLGPFMNCNAVSVISNVERMELEEGREHHSAQLIEQLHTAHIPDYQRQELKLLYERQRKIEAEAVEQAAREYKDLMLEMCKKKLAPNLPFAKSLMLGWFEPLCDAIQAELDAVEESTCKTNAGRYLRQTGLSADVLAVLTMHRLMALLMHDTEGGSVRLVQAALQIGDAVEQEGRIHKLLLKDKMEYPEDCNKQLQRQLKDAIKRKKQRETKKILKKVGPYVPWNTSIQAQVGSRLLELMIGTCFIHPPADQSPDIMDLKPAFKHIIQTSIPKKGTNCWKCGLIQCDPLIRQEIEKSARYIVMPYMPMLVPPRPWKGYNNGGHLYLRSTIMRTHGARQQKEAVRTTPRKNFLQVFQALDTLGNTSWKINTPVLDVVERIWGEGGRLGHLVDHDNVEVPPKPETDDKDEFLKWRRAAAKARRINAERHSQRCDVELKLTVARTMKVEELFYYPHNLDFRGRAYPMHPHLNHLGSDLCRGMLQFAEGRPLGSNGLRWLKIHLANLYGNGVDKMSFEGRVAYVEDNMEKVFDSAANPLKGDRWWLRAEDPFQCLATCLELSAAIKSGDVDGFISHIPVHQDGSCNGLQHYAALGRDQMGAQSVNLIAGDAPADVYSGIATRVRAIIEKEAAKDPSTSSNAANAKLLLGQVDRKLVKQTVMTSVYGVTFVGARAQIMNRLREKGCIADDVDLYRAACYAAKITLDALGEMFKEARCIMKWLGDCAKIIASDGEAVRWLTPLGLPVVQPYRRPGRHLVRTSLQSLALRSDSEMPVMVQRQRTAFPPNFVHSLDGSHMMMTAVACKNAGLAFAGVHDSFWTHAGDVEKLNVILREKFVELYSQPILENLLENFQKRLPHLRFPPVPTRGDFILDEVLRSPYFFN